MVDELAFLSVAEAGRLLLSREISPVDLVDALLDRIEAVDEAIKSYILVDADGARAKAKQAEAEIMTGRWRGPLHGIPYGVKDNYFTKGLRTCANSRVLLEHIPDFDAAAVEKLTAAGAILLGKLNTWEYGTGLGEVYHDAAYPHARNPWKDDYFTGGSSTGSGAGVAAGTAMFALGSDTGGSIRAPAALCGVQGLKPTYGRVSRYGLLPNCWSLDVAGPLTWTIEDAAIVTQAIAGYDPRDNATVDIAVPDYRAGIDAGVRGLRIGIVRDLRQAMEVNPAITAGIEDVATVLEGEGAIVTEITLPSPPMRYRETTALISGSERASAHERDFIEHADLMGRELRESMMAGFAARAMDYVAAQRRRQELARSMNALIKQFDAILLPCLNHVAPPFSDLTSVKASMGSSATTAFNISGHPALSIRTGFTEVGLPTSAQLAGGYFDEATLLRVAQAYESARDWHIRRPLREGSIAQKELAHA